LLVAFFSMDCQPHFELGHSTHLKGGLLSF
jgi:hypothetical protein